MNNNSDQSVGVNSDVPDYDWVDPHILDVATYFSGPTALDDFLSKVSILRPDSPSDATATNCYSHSN